MSRIQDALLGDKAYGVGVQTPLIDLRNNGYMGYSADMTTWVSQQQYVRRNVFCLLLEAPRGFQSLPNPEYWVGTLRALVELHALKITGLTQGLTVETAETPAGGGGQMHEDPTNVTEARSQVTFGWNEKYGMPIQRFHGGWIRYLIMDPNSKFAAINTIRGNNVTDLLADMYAATMIFIEPDPTHTKVVKSWLGANMWPKSNGEVTGERDVTTGGEAVNYDIEYAGILQFGDGIDAFAQKLLDAISLSGANPYNRAAFVDGISADVAAQSVGYSNGISDLASTAVNV